MKAVVCKQFGPPEGLVVEETAAPSPGPHDLRIGVHAAGVNFPDVLIVKGEYQIKPSLPFTPGAEVSGEVLEIGSRVTGFAVGDRVMAMTLTGGYAEELVVDASRAMKLPPHMDHVTAAGFMMTYGTSYHALVQRARLAPGETLLVHGATGGVGTSAIEIGKRLGARIIATGGSDEKLARIQQLYAPLDVINTRKNPAWKERVKELTGGRGADVIYDPVGGEIMEQSLRAIAWDGRLLVIGFASGVIPKLPANLVLLKSCSVVGVFWGAFVARDPELNADNFRQLFAWYEAGELAPYVSRTYPLEQASEALLAIVRREIVGKAVITTARHG